MVAGSLREFRGRGPAGHTARKLSPVSPDSVPGGVRVWMHGASVGEMGLVRRVRDWLAQGDVPPDRILVSSGTLSGLKSLDHPHRVLLPYDYPRLMKPLCRRVDADLLLVMETELWPNFYRYHDGRVLILNGRMKAETYRGYRRVRALIRATLGHCRGILARSETEARRFRALAADGVPVSAPGPLKWTGMLDSVDPLEDGPRFEDSRPVVVAGSTWPGDEDAVLELLRTLNVNLYLAPRHLDRLPEVRRRLKREGVAHELWSEAGEGTVQARVILVDVYGVLGRLYGRGDVAVVGGTWEASVGGHNVIEPARFGVPVAVGPHVRNVAETVRFLEVHDRLRRIESRAAWSSTLRDMLREYATTPTDTAVERRARRIESTYRTALERALTDG